MLLVYNHLNRFICLKNYAIDIIGNIFYWRMTGHVRYGWQKHG